MQRSAVDNLFVAHSKSNYQKIFRNHSNQILGAFSLYDTFCIRFSYKIHRRTIFYNRIVVGQEFYRQSYDVKLKFVKLI